MSESGTTQKINEIPKWDGKKETVAMFLTKMGAVIESRGLEHVLEENKMRTLPTKEQYERMDESNDQHKPLMKLYEDNKKVMIMLTLSQSSEHGLAAINKTKTGGHKAGVAWKVFKLWEKKHKPGDASAEVELESELEQLKFGGSANDYHDEVIKVTTRFGVVKTETELIKLLMKCMTNATFTKMAMDELNKAEDDRSFEDLCDQINVIQRMQKTGNSDRKSVV